MIDRLKYKNSYKFYLSSKSKPKELIPEPINFDEGNRNIYERDDNSKGFLIKKSNDLEFTGRGADFLIQQVYTKGVSEDVLLEKEIKSEDTLDEAWRSTVPIYLDLSELTYDEKKGGGRVAKSKAIEGGLKKIIESRKDDEINLKSTFDSFGNNIEELQTESIYLESRQIYLRSEASIEDGTEVRAAVKGGDRLNAKSVPFVFDVNSDQDNILSVYGTDLNAANDNFASLEPSKRNNVILHQVNTSKKLILNGRIEFSLPINDTSTGRNELTLVFYDNDWNQLTDRQIKLMDFNPFGNNTWVYEFVDFELNISAGESMAIGLLSDAADDIKYRFANSFLVIEEDSLFPPSNCKALTYKQALNRLLYIITGENNLVVSNWLDNGDLSEDLITNGFYIREFPDVVLEGTDEERVIPFNLKLSDLLNHIEALMPKAWWVENTGIGERFYIEKYIDTQRNNVFINIAEDNLDGSFSYLEASDISREVVGDLFFSKIILGSEKGGEKYEEVAGLRSINGKAEFATINKNTEHIYEKLSPFSLGDVDVELPRRKPYRLYPEEDTKYDLEISCIRAKKQGNKYVVKKWQDIYEVVPTGIYRPDTAYNLDLTPMRILLSHGFNIATAVYHYPNEKIVFLSSNCNSGFKSKKQGEVEISENGIIENSFLDKPTIKPYKIKCKVSISQELEDKITGKTNGVYNWFGKVALNTGGQIEYFRIISADPNKEGSLELIEAV